MNRLDPRAESQFTPLMPMYASRAGHCAAVANECIFAIGGRGERTVEVSGDRCIQSAEIRRARGRVGGGGRPGRGALRVRGGDTVIGKC